MLLVSSITGETCSPFSFYLIIHTLMRSLRLLRLSASIFFLGYSILCAYILLFHEHVAGHPVANHQDLVYFLMGVMLLSLFISFLFFNKYQNE